MTAGRPPHEAGAIAGTRPHPQPPGPPEVHPMRTLISSLLLAVALGAIPLASVAAHECVVVHRSANGNIHASGSGQWVTLTLTDLYEETELFGLPDLTPAQVDYAAQLAASLGVPGSATFRSDTLLPPSDAWADGGHATDGKGIDHFFVVYGDRIIGALFAALDNA